MKYRYLFPMESLLASRTFAETLEGEGWEIFGASPLLVNSVQNGQHVHVVMIAFSCRRDSADVVGPLELHINEQEAQLTARANSRIIHPNETAFPSRPPG